LVVAGVHLTFWQLDGRAPKKVARLLNTKSKPLRRNAASAGLISPDDKSRIVRFGGGGWPQ
jgi:hypothetical protein